MKITPEVLEDLKKAMVLTGRLSEIHVKNIQAYPFIFFENVKTVDIDYNIDVAQGSTDSYVNFDIKTKNKKTKITNATYRLETLKRSIETLLWVGIKVCVYINGKELKDV